MFVGLDDGRKKNIDNKNNFSLTFRKTKFLNQTCSRHKQLISKCSLKAASPKQP